MRYTGAALDDDWSLFELERAGNGKRPCSDEYAEDANDEELKHVLSQLKLLRAAGCPADLERGRPTYQQVSKYRVKAWSKEVAIHVLKAKPSRWRLYYIVHDHARKQIVFLFAASKKTNKRDPKDIARCERLLDAWAKGDYAAVELEVPTC